MSNAVNVGLLGCGKQSLKHIPALKKLNIRVVVADIDPSLAKSWAEEFGVDYVESVEEIFRDPEIDALDICTPTPTHYAVIKRAIKARKHFFCEKPLASSYDEALKIDALLDGTDLVGMVGYLYRFHPAFEMARECIMDGAIGKPYFAIFRLGGRGSHRIWKHKKEKGGGAVNEMMVHMLDLALWYFGPITRTRTLLFDTVLRAREVEGKTIKADAEDLALVHLETESGVKVICESDLITPSYMNHIEIQATNGSIITSILDYFPSLVYCKEPRGTYQAGNNVLHFPKVNLFEKELRHFLDCITNECPPERNTVRESAYLLKLIDIIKKQAEESHG
jgi:predicted dehydrogenase